MTTPQLPRPIEVQTPAGTLAPSFVRTLVPVLAGLVATWLIDKFAIEVDGATAGAVVTAVAGYVYYVIARFLEVFVSEKWGYVLGFKRTPVYAPTVPSTVIAADDDGTLGDRGAIALGIVGLVIGVVGLVLLVWALVVDRNGWVVPSAILMGFGLLFLVLEAALNRRNRL